jgi:hypothetical protein
LSQILQLKNFGTTTQAKHSLFFWTRYDSAVQSRASNTQPFAVIFSARGDGGKRSPELPRNASHVVKAVAE